MSSPPEANEATLCRASGLNPTCAANSKYLSAKASKAILSPPEADPVAPAKMLTATASEISGLPFIPITSLVRSLESGNCFYYSAKPTAALVFIIAVIEPAAFSNSIRESFHELVI